MTSAARSWRLGSTPSSAHICRKEGSAGAPSPEAIDGSGRAPNCNTIACISRAGIASPSPAVGPSTATLRLRPSSADSPKHKYARSCRTETPPSMRCGSPVGSAGRGGKGFGLCSSKKSSSLMPCSKAEASTCPAGNRDDKPSPAERGVLTMDFTSSKYSCCRSASSRARTRKSWCEASNSHKCRGRNFAGNLRNTSPNHRLCSLGRSKADFACAVGVSNCLANFSSLPARSLNKGAPSRSSGETQKSGHVAPGGANASRYERVSKSSGSVGQPTGQCKRHKWSRNSTMSTHPGNGLFSNKAQSECN
mmetsp:Transcript_20040/g.58193  ORF Transcript_20040/g.58193 Transcript_20040/m.58193 type:complete len:307 (-) Transcript_20040:5014-5934(-)